MFNYSGIQAVKPVRHAVVVGGGFIGLETAENLVHEGFDVTLVEMLDQVLAPLFSEIANLVEGHLESNGVHLALNDARSRIHSTGGRCPRGAETKSGKKYPADIVILALGVLTGHGTGQGSRTRDR